MRLFTEARFQFRNIRNGKPGDLFGTRELGILERPWPGGNTSDLLARALQDADLAGNNYYVRRAGPTARRMPPDWVWLILDRPGEEIDAEVVGYAYYPGGRHGGRDPIILPVDEVAHFAPIPDPQAKYRGMTWMTPVIREVMADQAAVAHKLAFFENGATPNLVVKRPDVLGKDQFREWVNLMEAGHAGAANAYRTLYLTAGSDATVVGANLRQLDFSTVQGHGETRVAAAAGVPPIIVGLSEGLAAATYSNYGQARRAFADLWARPMWRNFAGSIRTIVNMPPGADLWYDDTNIPFLAEDKADQANIAQVSASTINALITTGFEPDAAIKAVMANDLSLLTGSHSGLYSVQLQEPGTEEPPSVDELPDLNAPDGGDTE
jgi:phage portal protein BeeE